MPVTVAIDAMGGDFGPSVTVPAALAFIDAFGDARVILVGLEPELTRALASARSDQRARIEVQHASEKVTMGEPPADALRKKKDSSMRVAINLVKEGRADACISAGNTGALMAIARFVLKTLPGIDRPAIASQLPTRKGVVTALDLGANVNCTADQLVQFAAMGSALCAAVEGIERPSVGLLNIGVEDIKGNDIYKGTTDVVVCDGFVGNVALKTSEGLARMLTDFLKAEFSRNPLTKLAALIAWPVLTAFRRRIDPRRHNGATLVGLKGVVVKSHGGADVMAYTHALAKVHAEVTHHVLERIAQRIAAMPVATTASRTSFPATPAAPGTATSANA